MKTKIYLSALILVLTGFCAVAQTPTATKNYVMEITVKVSGKTDTSHLSGLTVAQANRSIVYFDGLGRNMQAVQWKGSPGEKDLVQLSEYDILGREVKKYLPYSEQSSNNGSFKTTGFAEQGKFYSASLYWDSNVAKTAYPFSKMLTDQAPLNRVMEQGAPGLSWQPTETGAGAGHSVKMNYGTNAANEVRLWVVNGSGASAGSNYYAAGTLTKTMTMDENWKTGKSGMIEEFKDMDGRVILKRIWATESSYLDTYYIYNDYNELAYVLPPAVTATSFVESDAEFKNYIYGYHYDARKRTTEKKIPGKGWDKIVYNILDQVVLTQDSMQRTGNKWLFVKYDAQGRAILKGEYNSSSSRVTLQAAMGTSNLWEKRDSTVTTTGYTNVAFPTSIAQYYVMSYYDDYKSPGLPGLAEFDFSSSYTKRVRNLPTATRTNVLGTSHFLYATTFYDEEGQVIRTAKQHYKGSGTDISNYDVVTNTYNFGGELTMSIRRHYVTGSQKLYVKNEFTYDHQGRKVDTYQTTGATDATVNNSAVLLSRLEYNEIGQLKNKKLNSTNSGSTFAQTIAYTYNERGWTKSQSSALFTQTLRYQDTVAGVPAQYNGNISRQEWGSGNYYNYVYDKLNRLNKAMSDAGNNEDIGYDVMGNITRLTRKLSGTLIDQLKYTYTNGNQLSAVLDSNANTNAAYMLAGTTNYTYNSNGSITGRSNTTNTANNISSMTYNQLGLPNTLVTPSSITSTFIYDASGNKIRKTIGSSLNNDYISGIHYEGGDLIFVQTEEGRAIKGSGTDPVYSYEYTLTDHLGNGRVYFDINAGAARKIQEQEYFAFGMDIQKSLSGTENKYQYNGKEKQDEMKMYDYSTRFYDPVIGRWNVVDALSESGRRFSVYTYAYNNPILFIDPDGMLGDYYTMEGEYLGTDGHEDDRVYAVEDGGIKSETTDSRGTTRIIDPEKMKMLPIGHKEFLSRASTIYGESSGSLVNKSDELRKEMFAIASVHLKNKIAYGAGNDAAKDFLATPSSKRNGSKKQFAFAAEINAQLGGADLSFGARQWDGAEQGLYPESNDKRSTGSFELHMNTQGWSISDDHYKKWKSAIGDKFVAPQTKAATVGDNKGKKRLESSAVYLKTIFWKVNP